MNKEPHVSDTIRKALETARKFIADSGPWRTRAWTERAWATLEVLDAALAQPQAAQPEPQVPALSDAEVRHIARTTPMGGSNRERDANLIRAGFDVGVSAAQPAPRAEPAAVGELPPLPDGRIVEIRDEHLPSQGETFDCIAFARAVEREVRSALASAPQAREPKP